ncbi:MAG: hypothetical protein Q4P13_00865, partial [Psychrobacter sp.]|nr:hypothetical protein [Psychrobacter sp.]
RLVLPFRIGLKALLEWVKQLIVRLNDYQTQQPYSPSTQRLILRQSAKQSPGTNKPRPKPKSKPRTVSPSAANARQAKKPRSTKAQKRRHSSYQKRQYGNHAPPVHQSSTLLSGLLKSKFNSSSNAKPNAQSTTTTKHSNRQRSSPPLVPSPNASQSSPFSGSPSPSIALLHHYRAAFLLAIILLLFTLLATFALVTSPSPQVKQVVSRGDHPSIQIRTTAGSATLANKIKAVTAEDNAIAKSNISDLEAQKLRVTAENKRLTQQNALLETLQDPEASKTLKADAHYKLQKTYLEDIIALRLKLPDDIRDTLPSGQQYPVTVMITLTQFGNVERVKVTESSGTHAVDEYAIKSLMTLEFTPVSLTNAAPTSNYYLDLIYTN